MPLIITGLYTGILGLLMVLLATRVSGERMKQHASLGSAGSPPLLEVIRQHGNFVEWVPFALLLMAVCEINGLEKPLLHGAGASLVLARLLHPFGVKHDVVPHPLRALGAGLTCALVCVLSATAIWLSL